MRRSWLGILVVAGAVWACPARSEVVAAHLGPSSTSMVDATGMEGQASASCPSVWLRIARYDSGGGADAPLEWELPAKLPERKDDAIRGEIVKYAHEIHDRSGIGVNLTCERAGDGGNEILYTWAPAERKVFVIGEIDSKIRALLFTRVESGSGSLAGIAHRIMRADGLRGIERYDVVAGQTAWVAVPSEGVDVIWGKSAPDDAGTVRIGALPGEIDAAQRRTALRHLADHGSGSTPHFCASGASEHLWLSVVPDELCKEATGRTWRIWYGGAESAHEYQEELTNLRLQLADAPGEADVEIEHVVELGRRIRAENDHADAELTVLLTRHAGTDLLLRRSPSREVGVDSYLVAAAGHEEDADVCERVVALETEAGLPMDDDNGRAALRAALDALCSFEDLYAYPSSSEGGKQLVFMARRVDDDVLSKILVWPGQRVDPGSEDELVEVRLGEKARPAPARGKDIARALRGRVLLDGAVQDLYLEGRATGLRLCSTGWSPFRLVGEGGAGEMDVPLWAGREVACKDYRGRDWDSVFGAMAGLDEPRLVFDADSEGAFIAARGDEASFMLHRSDGGKRRSTECATGLAGEESKALVRHLLSRPELTCSETAEIGGGEWAAAMWWNTGNVIALAEECRLELRGPPRSFERDAPYVSELDALATRYRRRVETGCTTSAAGRWLVALDELFFVVDGELWPVSERLPMMTFEPRDLEREYLVRLASWLASPAIAPVPAGLQATLRDGQLIIRFPSSGGDIEHDLEPRVVLTGNRCVAGLTGDHEGNPVRFSLPDFGSVPSNGGVGEDGYTCEIIIEMAIDGKDVNGDRSVEIERRMTVAPGDSTPLLPCLGSLGSGTVTCGADVLLGLENGSRERLDAFGPPWIGKLFDGVLAGQPWAVDLIAAVPAPGWKVVMPDQATQDDSTFLLHSGDADPRVIRFNHVDETCRHGVDQEISDALRPLVLDGRNADTASWDGLRFVGWSATKPRRLALWWQELFRTNPVGELRRVTVDCRDSPPAEGAR